MHKDWAPMQLAFSGSEPLVDWQDDAKVMALVGMAHACSHFSHLLLPLMFPIFIRDFGWSFSELGLLSTLFFVVSGTGQACAGFVVDRVGARPVLFISQLLFMGAAPPPVVVIAATRCFLFGVR